MTDPAEPSYEAPPSTQAGRVTHRQIPEAMSGLLLAMFVAMLSSTVVTNALLALVCVLFIQEVLLRTTLGRQGDAAQDTAEAGIKP